MTIEDVRKSLTSSSMEAIRAIDELNSGKRNKFPSQKEISREDLVLVCRLLRHQLDEALEKCHDKSHGQDIGQEETFQERTDDELEEEFHDATRNVNTQDEREDLQPASTGTSTTVEASNQTCQEHTGPASGTKDDTKVINKTIKPVCRFHKYKKCNNKKTCKFDHPKICNKYMQHGLHKTNPEKGCKKSDCQLYHPPLCYGSMKYRECRTKDVRGSTCLEPNSEQIRSRPQIILKNQAGQKEKTSVEARQVVRVLHQRQNFLESRL